MLPRPDSGLAGERATTAAEAAAAAEAEEIPSPEIAAIRNQKEIRMTAIHELRGAAIPAALAAAEKRLPAAQLAAKAAQAQLDLALADGRDSREYRAKLETALREKRAIHSQIQEIRALIENRNEEKIIAVAAAISECANAQRDTLLTRFEFSF